MSLFKKFRAFRRMSVADQVLLVEAIAMLALARFTILTVPFRRIAPWLSRPMASICCDEELVFRVRRAVTMAARNVPWNAVCLPQALAAKAMLARRGCGSTFHLGAGTSTNGNLIAHAWLAVGKTIVVGAAGMNAVTPVARFG